jgi:small subunit ribosomal protein S20
MNKKQRNRKDVSHNKRNKIQNRRYLSTIRTLFKLFSLKIKDEKKNILLNQPSDSNENFRLLGNLYSILDKAVKKKVIHKNTAARKKSKIYSIYSKQ